MPSLALADTLALSSFPAIDALENVTSLVSIGVSGRTFVVAGSSTNTRLAVFEPDASGNLTLVREEITDTLGRAQATMKSGTDAFVIIGGSRLEAWRIDSAGDMTFVSAIDSTAAAPFSSIAWARVAEVGGARFVIAASNGDDSVFVVPISDSGVLGTATDHLTDTAGLAIDDASRISIVEMGSRTFVYVAGVSEDAIQPFELQSNGTLTEFTPHTEGDSGFSNLTGIQGLKKFVSDDTTFLLVTGDDGMTTYRVSSSGALTLVQFDASGEAESGDASDYANLRNSLIARFDDVVYAFVSDFSEGPRLFRFDALGRFEEIAFLGGSDGGFANNMIDGASFKVDGDQFFAAVDLGGTGTLATFRAFLGPDLRPDGDNARLDKARYSPGDDLSVSIEILNEGDESASSSFTEFWFSEDQTLDGGDDFLGQRATGAIAAGGQETVSASLELPGSAPTGGGWLLAVADADDDVDERDETDNVAALRIRIDPFTSRADDVRLETADRWNARGGNDKVTGSTGDDTVLGGGGNDTLLGRRGDDVLKGNAGVDLIKGQAGADRLIGGDDNDRVQGGGGSDRVEGGKGDDRLFGNGGGDRLVANKGADVLTGGAGADGFQFKKGDGTGNRVTDFSGKDFFIIKSGAESFSDLAITAIGNDRIGFDGSMVRGEGFAVRVDDVLPGQLGANDFEFI